jgi:hypothetical protein
MLHSRYLTVQVVHECTDVTTYESTEKYNNSLYPTVSFNDQEIPLITEPETSWQFTRDCQCTSPWVALIDFCLFWTLQRQHNRVLKWQTFAWCVTLNMLLRNFGTLQWFPRRLTCWERRHCKAQQEGSKADTHYPFTETSTSIQDRIKIQ